MKPPVYKFIKDDNVVKWIEKKFYKDTNIFAPEEDSKTSNYRTYSYSQENAGTSTTNFPIEQDNKSQVASLYSTLGLGIKRKRGRPRKNFNPFLDFNYTLEKQSRPQEATVARATKSECKTLGSFEKFSLRVPDHLNETDYKNKLLTEDPEELLEGLDDLEDECHEKGAEDDLDVEEEEELEYENQAYGDDADLVFLRLRKDMNKKINSTDDFYEIGFSSSQSKSRVKDGFIKVEASVDAQFEKSSQGMDLTTKNQLAEQSSLQNSTKVLDKSISCEGEPLKPSSFRCNVSLVDINLEKKQSIPQLKSQVLQQKINPLEHGDLKVTRSPRLEVSIEKLDFSDIYRHADS